MLSPLSPAQRDELATNGTPVPVMDEESGQAYVLLAVSVETNPKTGDFSAHLPGIPVYAEGATDEEAVVCLAGAMSAYLGE